MPGKLFLRLNRTTGLSEETRATQASAGSANAGDVIAADDTGHLDPSWLPTGVGADTATIQASEDLAAGDLVNVWSSGGSFRARKADASAAGKQAHGYVLAAATSGTNATVYFEGRNTSASSVTPGTLFLSTTAGKATATPPTGAGQVVQVIGVGVAASEINVELDQPVLLAA